MIQSGTSIQKLTYKTTIPVSKKGTKKYNETKKKGSKKRIKTKQENYWY